MKIKNRKSGLIAELITHVSGGYKVRTPDGKTRYWKCADPIPEPESATTPEIGFSEDQWFRFVMLPYLLADIVWDYTETVCDQAVMMKIPALKMPIRELRNLYRDFRSQRNERTLTYVRECLKTGEEAISANVIDREDEISREILLNLISTTTNTQCHALSTVINTTFPGIKQDDPDLYIYLQAITLAIAVSHAFVVYSNKARQAYLNIGKNISLPQHLVKLHRALPVLLGNYSTDEIKQTCYKAGEEIADSIFRTKLKQIDRTITA